MQKRSVATSLRDAPPAGARTLYEDGSYARGHPCWHVQQSSWKAAQVLCALQRNGIEPGSVAEVGCGAGEILRQLQLDLPEETSFVGFEISSDAYALCQTRANSRLRFVLGDAEDDPGEFEVLLLLDVIEHVEDYLGFLRSLRSHARYTIAHLPLDMSAHSVLRRTPALARRVDGHLHYFMKETALCAFAECGYRVVDWFYTPVLDLYPPARWWGAIANWVRRAGFAVAPDLTVRALGCYGLIVVAEAAPSLQ